MKVKRILGFLCAGILLAGTAQFSVSAETAYEIQNELNDYHSQLSDAEAESQELAEQIAELQEETVQMIPEIEALNIQLEEYRDAMTLRIKYFYEESPEYTIWSAMFGADDFADFLNKMEYMQIVYDYDSSQLNIYASLAQEAEEKQQAYDDKIAELSDLLDKQEALQEELKEQISEKEKELQKAEGLSSGVLTKSKGAIYFNGHRETWYSQRVLPGGKLNIPGRHVASDGTIRDKDNYICVASSDYPKGTVVQTSLGPGKVYDTGCASGTIDIYTDW